MKKRWIGLFVENDVGVLARIAGLFSGKAYNLDSLTVGVTGDPTVSRMTIGLTSDDKTFAQVKNQLERCIEVLKVVDYTGIAVHRKELMFVKLHCRPGPERDEVCRLAQEYCAAMLGDTPSALLLESVQSECRNDALLASLKERYTGWMEVVRGGSVAIEEL